MNQTPMPAAAGSKNVRMLVLNDVRISGRLTDDPKSRSTRDGRMVVHMNLAINRRYKDAKGAWHEEASFVPVTVWNALAEQCKHRLKKGCPLYVEGRLRSESWKAQSGQNRYALKVDVSKVRFMNGEKPETVPPTAGD